MKGATPSLNAYGADGASRTIHTCLSNRAYTAPKTVAGKGLSGAIHHTVVQWKS